MHQYNSKRNRGKTNEEPEKRGAPCPLGTPLLGSPSLGTFPLRVASSKRDL